MEDTPGMCWVYGKKEDLTSSAAQEFYCLLEEDIVLGVSHVHLAELINSSHRHKSISVCLHA